MSQNTLITGEAAGVPFLAVPPAGRPGTPAPVVVTWHMMDAPRTEAAFAAALPLEGLDAWRIYLGLPLFGSRLPDGGFDEIMRLAGEDAVLNLHEPVTSQAVEEFPDVLDVLRSRLNLGNGPLGVMGGSMGAAIALIVIAERVADIEAAVLVSPVVQLRAMVAAMSRQYGFTYPWPGRSLDVARRLDFVGRADEIAGAGEPAILLIVGEQDDAEGFLHPAGALRDALASRYDDARRTDLVVVPNMGHALAEEPGMEPAPQTPHAAEVDRHAVRWLRRHLGGRA